jgi:choline dehydrogenase-like flavoprotein
MNKVKYLIVGGGSAGCVLANRLSARRDHLVLLLEAGPKDEDRYIRIPMGIGKTLANPLLNWWFQTEPEPGNAFRPRIWMRGRTLGGSSAINGMMYMRGQPDDYDAWEAQGNEGWGWQHMSRCFRQIEDHELGDDGVRGVGGPLHISLQSHRSPLTEAVLQAGVQLGLERRADINRAQQEGIAYTPVTIQRGRRVSAADAFLRPVLGRPNLQVLTNVLVDRVRFDQGRATGVEAKKDGQAVFYEADEVILSAGTLQSPKLLQLSGIGPGPLLNSFNIPVLIDNPAVGAHMREHKVQVMQARLRKPYSHNQQLQGFRLYLNALRYALTRGGPLASTYDVTAFVRTDQRLRQPDAQITFWSLSLNRSAASMKLEAWPGLFIMGYPLRTESEGSLTLRSANPADPPIVKTNFLDSPYDRRVMLSTARFMRRFLAQSPLNELIESETHPGNSVQSDEDLLDACREDDTCMHAVGTCRMGPDGASVVDSQLRVRGVRNLRVVDCSVMPTQVSGNTNGPVMALAWRAAERILENPGT